MIAYCTAAGILLARCGRTSWPTMPCPLCGAPIVPWRSQGNGLFEALSPPNWFIPVHYDARVRGTLYQPLILPASQMVVTPVEPDEIHVSSFESQEDLP